MTGVSESQKGNAEEAALLERCKATVQRLVPGATLILYGSRSRHDAEPASDYDLLILVDEVGADVEDQLGDLLYEIELEHGIVISALVFDRRSWKDPRYQAMPLHQNIDRDGIVL